MQALRNWRLGRGQSTELLRYDPEQEPPAEDIEKFVEGAKAQLRVLPLQTSRYVLREPRQAISWLKSYIACEVEDLRANFAREDKSFYVALLEHVSSGDRSVSFRLTTAGLAGHTEWAVSFRRVCFDGEDYYLCAEY